MYRTTAAMIEGWTKNLALLFNNTLATRLASILDILLLVGLPWLAIRFWNGRFSPFPGVARCGMGSLLLWVRTLVPLLLACRRNRTFRLSIARSLPWDCRSL